jgi:hypothetical protein
MSTSGVLLEGRTDFGPFCQSRVVLFPTVQTDVLSDIYIRLWGEQNSQSGQSCNGIRLSVIDQSRTETDITADLLREFQSQLDTQMLTIMPQYITALKAWLDRTKSIRIHRTLFGDLGDIDSQLPLDLVKAEPLRGWNLLGAFGETTDWGWRGGGHIFNFIYNQLDLAPISLNEAISYRLKLTDLIGMRIIAPNYERASGSPAGDGSVGYTFEFAFGNNESDLLSEILRKVGTSGLQAQVTLLSQQLQAMMAKVDSYDNIAGDNMLAGQLLSAVNQLTQTLNNRPV